MTATTAAAAATSVLLLIEGSPGRDRRLLVSASSPVQASQGLVTKDRGGQRCRSVSSCLGDSLFKLECKYRSEVPLKILVRPSFVLEPW
ncbi:hypothetical protein BCV69DRAFT_125920 [Microstroma glucosiphilum]|uniref:Uncharacterized protein n=1 Tax=Pseudomicrostroma glucosiphilum TaxID=1684307 RepID=A0A316TWK9_9BASI|nr:hypothetical protein BCV69DRAFT_125920 [Pseudomicrostroma glucosiphilum]PWN17866.1 hypothetical protein BCV69DRAFT_125920 [Pseudomicrostroma glucosiphilum]